MVQREVADRFFAAPRTKAYGAVSVLVQLSARKTGFHPVPPTVFRPKPRVESALVAFERDTTARIEDVRPVVEAAFGHRRKTAANALAQAGIATKSRSRGRWRRSGSSRTREPRSWRRRNSWSLPGRCDEVGARVREDQPGSRRRSRDATESTTSRPSCSRSTCTTRSRSRLREALVVEGFPEDTIVRDALEALGRAAGCEPRWRVRIEKRIPVAAGLGGGSTRCRDRALARERFARPAARSR